MTKTKTEKLSHTIDLDGIVFDGDRGLRADLHKDPEFAEIVRELDGAGQIASARHELLRTSLKLTSKIAPEVFDAVETVKEALGLRAEIELFCVPENEINAFVAPPEKGRVLIGVSAAALEKLDEQELAFILGHEMGHVVFDHFALNPDVLAGDPRLSPAQVARLFAWLRYAELSADRVGLLCADRKVALRAFFKLTSGLTEGRFLDNAEEAAKQFAELDAADIATSEADWFSTHPYSPLRLRAIDLFGRSQTYHRLRGERGGELDEATLEKEVKAIMSLMDPIFLDDNRPHVDEARAFLAIAAVDVATADEKITREEEDALFEIAGDDADMLARMSPEERAAKLEELAGPLALHFSQLEREKLVEDLVAVAVADHEVHENEVAALSMHAAMLAVDPFFVDEVIGRFSQPLD